MGREPPLLRAWEGTAFRATTYDVPLWVRPNRRGGRWNVPGRTCAQYLCLDADAPYAEMLRALGLRGAEEAAMLRLCLWEVELHEAAIADYSTFELADAAGFPADALVDDDHDRCRREAEHLMRHGARGVLAPSAALPGATSLTLFGPRVEVAWGTQPKLSSEVPVRRIGGKGPPPLDVIGRVRHYGEPHPDLVRYREAAPDGRRSAGDR